MSSVKKRRKMASPRIRLQTILAFNNTPPSYPPLVTRMNAFISPWAPVLASSFKTAQEEEKKKKALRFTLIGAESLPTAPPALPMNAPNYFVRLRLQRGSGCDVQPPLPRYSLGLVAARYRAPVTEEVR